MKTLSTIVKEKLVAKYSTKDTSKVLPRSTDINVLLNRVKNNQRNESRKKIFFSAVASTGLVIFGLIIF